MFSIIDSAAAASRLKSVPRPTFAGQAHVRVTDPSRGHTHLTGTKYPASAAKPAPVDLLRSHCQGHGVRTNFSGTPWRFTTMADKRIYVERRPEGDYAVRRPDADRASAVEPTQREAIERARELNPGIAPHVERVRNTVAGGRDKWRKP